MKVREEIIVHAQHQSGLNIITFAQQSSGQ